MTVVGDKEWSDQVVCKRWCVTKLCVKESDDKVGGGGGAGRRERDTESKARTPHKDVGKNNPL